VFAAGAYRLPLMTWDIEVRPVQIEQWLNGTHA